MIAGLSTVDRSTRRRARGWALALGAIVMVHADDDPVLATTARAAPVGRLTVRMGSSAKAALGQRNRDLSCPSSGFVQIGSEASHPGELLAHAVVSAELVGVAGKEIPVQRSERDTPSVPFAFGSNRHGLQWSLIRLM